MTDHILDPVRGPQVGHRLEYVGPIAPGEEWVAGRCISADDYGRLRKGCPAGSDYNRPMPMFAIEDSDALDVWSDNANPQTYGSGAPEGQPAGLPASGGFELATTEFEYLNGDDAVVYNVNDQLTCDADGKLIKKTSDSEPTVGIVSVCRNANQKLNAIDVPIQNRWNHPMLTFWTFFIPATGNGSN